MNEDATQADPRLDNFTHYLAQVPFMDVLTGSTTFATITSLIGLYRSERTSRKDRSLADYVEWLRRHDHQQVIETLNKNTELAQSLQSVIEDQHDQVMASLVKLDTIMCSIAEHLTGIGPLAVRISVTEKLSNQAVSILCQMVKAGTGSQIRTGTAFGDYAIWTGSMWQRLECEDHGLLPADFARLVELNLLLRSKERGLEVFRLTREGAAVGQSS